MARAGCLGCRAGGGAGRSRRRPWNPTSASSTPYRREATPTWPWTTWIRSRPGRTCPPACATRSTWSGSTVTGRGPKSSPDPKVAQQRAGQAQAYLSKFVKEHPRDPRGAGAMAYRADLAVERRRDPGRRQGHGRQDEEETTSHRGPRDHPRRLQAVRRVGRVVSGLARPGPFQRGQDQAVGRRRRPAAGARAGLDRGAVQGRSGQLPASPDLPGGRRPGAQGGADQDRPVVRRHLSGLSRQARTTPACSPISGTPGPWTSWATRPARPTSTTSCWPGPPDVGAGDPEAASVFAEAALFQLRQVAAKGNPAEFLDEANEWLEAHKACWKH